MQIINNKLFTENVIVNLESLFFIEAPLHNSTIKFRERGNNEILIVDYYDKERRDKVFRLLANHFGFAAEHPC